MKYSYVAIEREYGSGGTKIANRLANECGIPCYGREILEAVSKEQGIPVEQIDRYEETVTNSFLYSIFVMGRIQSGNPDVLAAEGHIHFAEQAVIQRLASEGPAIFLGHCASEALKQRNGVLRVFIFSDLQSKIKRIIEDYEIPSEAAEAAMKRFDKKRANYYSANTTRKWDDIQNYDLILNSGRLGINGCAAALKGMLQRRNNLQANDE